MRRRRRHSIASPSRRSSTSRTSAIQYTGRGRGRPRGTARHAVPLRSAHPVSVLPSADPVSRRESAAAAVVVVVLEEWRWRLQAVAPSRCRLPQLGEGARKGERERHTQAARIERERG